MPSQDPGEPPFEIPKCQHCGAVLYDNVYKLVNPDKSLSRETYCHSCDEIVWVSKKPLVPTDE